MNLPPRDERPHPVDDIAADDPSIPVLNERLHLQELEIDMGLPAQQTPMQPAEPVAEPAPAAVEPPIESTTEAVEQVAAERQDEIAPVAEAVPTPAPHDATPADELTPASDQAPSTPAPQLEDAACAAPVVDADELREAVLSRMQGKVNEQINETLRDLLQPAIDDAIVKLADEARFALRLTIQELVERALREELNARRCDERDGDSSGA